MAGIYGFVGDTSHQKIIESTLMHQKRYVSNSRTVNDDTCIGIVDFSFKNTEILEKDDYVISLNGEFYTEKTKVNSSLEFIHNLYLEYGDDFVTQIDGIFNISIYNKKKKQFKIFNDWAGNHNLFYYQQSDCFFYATEIKAILKIAQYKTFNKKAAVSQFMFSHILFEDTLVNEIKLLPPGSILSFENSTLTVKKYYDLKNAYKPFKLSNEKNDIDKLYSLFENCTNKFLDKRDISLPLTGGMDSRLLLHFMLKIGYDFRDIYTSKSSLLADPKIAKKICDDLGLKHRINKTDFSEHVDLFLYNYIVNEGFLPSNLFPRANEKIFQNNCNYIIQYPSANMTFGDLYTPNTKDFIGAYRLNDKIISKIIAKFVKMSEMTFNSIFNKEYWFFNEIQDEIREYLNKISEFNSLYVFDYFAWYQHCRRWSNIGGMNGKFIGRVAPSQDRKLVEFSFNMPVKYHYWQYIHKKMFKIKCPELAKYPREGTGVPLSWPNWLQLIMKAINKKLLPEKYSIDKLVHPETYYRNYVNDKIEQLINSSSLAERGIFKVDELKKIFHEHQSGENYWYIIHNIMNLEIFLKEYLD